jgi:hypothetical protein
MRFVLIQTMINSSKRWRNKLRINLQPPAETGEGEYNRKDRTGLIFFLLAITLILTVMFLS